MRRNNSAVAEQIIGELICYLPLFTYAVLIGILKHVALATAVFFICKWGFDKRNGAYLHIDTKYCVLISYATFFLIGFVTAGIEASLPFIGKQPLIPITLSLIATYAWAGAGDIQQRLKKVP